MPEYIGQRANRKFLLAFARTFDYRVESMPERDRWFARIMPPMYFVGIMRAVCLKVTSPAEPCDEFAARSFYADIRHVGSRDLEDTFMTLRAVGAVL